MTETQALAYIERLHAVVDELAAKVAARHGPRLNCTRGCSACCTDGLTVFAVEARRIQAAFAPLLAEGEPGPTGACAFLDEDGACRIYAARPYVCRTQGLPLRWLEIEEDEAGETQGYEARDICPLNAEGGPPVEALSPADCWDVGPFEARLAAVQDAVDGGAGQRVALRSLFSRAAREG